MKNKLLTLIMCVTALAFTTMGQAQDVLYEADFTAGEPADWVKVAGEWEIKNHPWTDEPNHYSSVVIGDKLWTYYNGASFENFELETVIYPQYQNPFGVVFNIIDADNYFILEISPKRKAAWIWQVEEGDFIDGFHWEPKEAEPDNHIFLHANWAINSPWIENDADPANYFTINIKNDAEGLTTITINGDVAFTDLDDVGSGGKLGVWANWNPTFVKSFVVKSLEDDQVNVAVLSAPRINLYPNPVVDILKFSTMVQNIEVFNVTGMKMRAATNVEAIDMSGLESGLYFIRLNNMETHKIMLR